MQQAGQGRARQTAIYLAGLHRSKPAAPTDFATLERRARRVSSRRGWAYAAGGAGAEATMRANRAAFERRQIVPRMLRDVSQRDTSVELFGRRIPAPVAFAPIGAAELLHSGADMAGARAAAELGVPYVFSSQAGTPMEQCAGAMGAGPRWFQLYWSTDEDLTDSFIARAEACGAEALVVTLDTTMLGWRPRDLNLGSLPFIEGKGIAQYTSDNRFREIVRERLAGALSGAGSQRRVSLGALRALLSMSRRHPGNTWRNLVSAEPRTAVQTFLDVYSRPTLNWSDIESLPERTRLPVLLKGIQHPDDARRALDSGVSGIIVSNHGGRQVDGAIGALDALAEIAPVVGDRTTLLLDSGIRSGSDVFKALALGANAVLIGRPYLYGLAVDGRNGAAEVVSNIIAEFDLTLGLSGLTSTGDLTPGALRVA